MQLKYLHSKFNWKGKGNSGSHSTSINKVLDTPTCHNCQKFRKPPMQILNEESKRNKKQY